MMTELLRTETQTINETAHFEDGEDKKYSYDVPTSKSMIMRISFYSTKGDKPMLLRQDNIVLSEAMTYYMSVSCALSSVTAEGSYRAGIVYW